MKTKTLRDYLHVLGNPEDFHPELVLKCKKEVENNSGSLLCFSWTVTKDCRKLCSYSNECESYNFHFGNNAVYKDVFYTIIIIDEW
jgi:hypothetical protein